MLKVSLVAVVLFQEHTLVSWELLAHEHQDIYELMAEIAGMELRALVVLAAAS